MSLASGTAVSILHRFSETPIRDHLVEIEHHQERSCETSSNTHRINQIIANR